MTQDLERQHKIIQAYHDLPAYGHPGISQTRHLVSKILTITDHNCTKMICYARTGRSSQLEVFWSGVGSGTSALATCDADMW